MSFFRPAAGNITSYYGETEGRRIPHTGIDFGWGGGKTIYAAEAGGVLAATYTGADFGNRIRLQHAGFETRYSHLAEFWVSPEEQVAKGQAIGWMGNTGNAVYEHLHFEVYVNGRHVDPLPYLTGTADDNIRPFPIEEDTMPQYVFTDQDGVGYALLDPAYVDGVIVTADPKVAEQFSYLSWTPSNQGAPAKLDRAAFNAKCAAAVALWRAYAAKSATVDAGKIADAVVGKLGPTLATGADLQKVRADIIAAIPTTFKAS